MASRTGWLLWLDRLSMTTMSPGASAGTRTCLTDSRKPSPLMEPSRSWVAVTPLSRSPATSVVFLRCPCGTAARRRTPLGARPYRRAMLVQAKLSSTNTSFAGSRSSWASNQSSRRSTTSGRSCSAACRDFFLKVRPQRSRKVQIVPVLGTHAFLLDEPALQFFDGGVRCGLDHRQQEVAMGVELGAGPASLPACRTLAAVAQTLNPLDRCRNADVEANRGLARRRPVSRGLNHSVQPCCTDRLVGGGGWVA